MRFWAVLHFLVTRRVEEVEPSSNCDGSYESESEPEPGMVCSREVSIVRVWKRVAARAVHLRHVRTTKFVRETVW